MVLPPKVDLCCRNHILQLFRDLSCFSLFFLRTFNSRVSLKKAGLYEKINNLPLKVNTPLYKNFDVEGVELSGGEMQKIAIARALYKDAPIVILDEPTASIDPYAEYEVYSKFAEITKGKTAIYISHRLASCIFCDKIAVLDNGYLKEYGTHTNLIKLNGIYTKMWSTQAQYYKL